MPRFVVQLHRLSSHGPSHFDWMFEDAPSAMLKTWAIDDEVAGDLPIELPCRALQPHRSQYLVYEGPISNDRGSVSRWDYGSFELLQNDSNHFAAAVNGIRLHGQVLFECSFDQWRFKWIPNPKA